MISYIVVQKNYTFTLADVGIVKAEQIQPIFQTVKVRGNCDTDVVFTDVETGKKFKIGYITAGLTEKIKLQKNKWYTVSAGGKITLNPVNVRIE